MEYESALFNLTFKKANMRAKIHQAFSRSCLVFYSRFCKFECNTTSDWLNRMV